MDFIQLKKEYKGDKWNPQWKKEKDESNSKLKEFKILFIGHQPVE